MTEASDSGRVDQTGWLVAHGLAKKFGKTVVVRDVSIAVRRGGAGGRLGPQRPGKTTGFTPLMGPPKTPTGPRMPASRPSTPPPPFPPRRGGLRSPPPASSGVRGPRVKDNILAVLEGRVKSRGERRARLETLMQEFGITHLANKNALALSGGERRRLEIARAIAADPVFMLLDEPFAGVDPIAVADVKALVRALTERGIGVLITDHSVRETLSLVDRAYLIYGGQVMIQGRPETIINDPDARRVYLGDTFDS